jgi:hypothetical protein
MVERIAIARSDMAVAVHVAQQASVDAGQPLLPDLATKSVLDLEVGSGSKVKRDQLGGALAHAVGQILAGDDQVPPAIVLPRTMMRLWGWWSTATQSSFVPRSCSTWNRSLSGISEIPRAQPQAARDQERGSHASGPALNHMARRLVIVARRPMPLDHALIFHCHFEDRAGGKLAHILSMQLLPRRLIDEVGELQHPPSLRQFGI